MTGDENKERNAAILAEARGFAAEIKRIFGEDLVSALLFGSCATGANHAESDIDIALVLTPRGKASFSTKGDERSYACDSLERGVYERLGMPVSLLLFDVERFEKEKLFGGGLARSLASKSIDLLKEGDFVDERPHPAGGELVREFAEALVREALTESVFRLGDCLSRMERARWRAAHNELFFAVYHAANAALAAAGKDPGSYGRAGSELATIAGKAGFESGYIRLYHERMRLRNLSVYTYFEDVGAFNERETRRALAEAYAWIAKTVDELVLPVVPLSKSFETMLAEAGLDKRLFAADR